jgi:hypothetical protein
MRKAQSFLRQSSQVGRHVLFAVRPQRRLLHTDVIPTQVVDHEDDNVGFVGSVCGDAKHQNQKYRQGSHHLLSSSSFPNDAAAGFYVDSVLFD